MTVSCLAALIQVHWDVSPELIRLGPLAVRWYSLCWFLAFIVGYLIVRWMYRREGKRGRDLESLLLYMLLGAIIGARLGHVLFYQPGYYLTHPLEIVAFWKGISGLASHGGALGILAALYLYSRRHPDQPYCWLLDRIAAPTALGGCFIRLGNLMNSEILGVPTNVPWAVVFTRVDSLPRHPAQVYEAIAYLVTFVLLLSLYRTKGSTLPRGVLTGVFFICVFTARFFIEFVKERHAAYAAALPLSVGQLLSLPLIILGLAVLARALAKRTAP